VSNIFNESSPASRFALLQWKLRWFPRSERDRALPESRVTLDSLDHVQAVKIHSQNRLKLLCGHFSSSSNHVHASLT
jgi:hypothetical protein